jgi:MFS superfamily sulfate permease-like transporter
MFLPSGVNSGFTLGVAFIIGGGQLASICGLSGLPVHHDFIGNFTEAVSHLGSSNTHAVLTFLFTFYFSQN